MLTRYPDSLFYLNHIKGVNYGLQQRCISFLNFVTFSTQGYIQQKCKRDELPIWEVWTYIFIKSPLTLVKISWAHSPVLTAPEYKDKKMFRGIAASNGLLAIAQ
jgi:hypothetical protein